MARLQLHCTSLAGAGQDRGDGTDEHVNACNAMRGARAARRYGLSAAAARPRAGSDGTPLAAVAPSVLPALRWVWPLRGALCQGRPCSWRVQATHAYMDMECATKNKMGGCAPDDARGGGDYKIRSRCPGYSDGRPFGNLTARRKRGGPSVDRPSEGYLGRNTRSRFSLLVAGISRVR